MAAASRSIRAAPAPSERRRHLPNQRPRLRLGDVEEPERSLHESGDASIAYYVVGDGPRDLVFVPFMVSMVFAWHLLPLFRDFCYAAVFVLAADSL